MKKKLVKLLSVCVGMVFILPFCTWISIAVNETQLPVAVNAKSAILVDVSTGKVLAAMNEHERLYPASVTKIMTLLLVMEAIDSGNLKLTDTVVASGTAAAKGGSQIWLKEGETMTVDELLRAAAIYSANDACEALGEHIAGSEEALVRMLNERARELGMNDTHFDNCTGLDDTTQTHLTSAYDIALMSVELLKHELIRKYTTVWMDSLRNGATELVNTNKLIRFYDGATGLKTGTTAKAGCCISASAERDGTHLVAVIMGSPTSNDRFDGAKALLNWGFANFETVTPQLDKNSLVPVKVIGGVEKSFMPALQEIKPVLIRKGEAAELKQNILLAADVQAPVEPGQKVGSVSFTLGDEVIGEYSLSAPERIDALTFTEVMRRILCSFSVMGKNMGQN